MASSNPKDWDKLSQSERLTYSRQAALEAVAHAESVGPTMRGIYERLATEWRAVAAQLEAEHNRAQQS